MLIVLFRSLRHHCLRQCVGGYFLLSSLLFAFKLVCLFHKLGAGVDGYLVAEQYATGF